MTLLTPLDVQQVPVFETFVVPRYLSLFGALALEMLLPCDGAVVANLGCRTGYPDAVLPRYLPQCHMYGFDASEEAIELARTKGSLLKEATVEYHLASAFPLPVPDASFSHAIVLYPLVKPERRIEVIAEAARLLAPGGQVLYALPLRGSYQEVADLMREYALKHDAGQIAKALEAYVTSRPTVESFVEEFEQCVLTDVDVAMRRVTLSFASGRCFFEDPIARSLVIPDFEISLGVDDLSKSFDYVRDAIDRYWSEEDFELSLNVGCASARKT